MLSPAVCSVLARVCLIFSVEGLNGEFNRQQRKSTRFRCGDRIRFSAPPAEFRKSVLFDFEQTAPALAMRGHPRLTKAGNGQSYLDITAPPRRGKSSHAL
jgi:hypothetical protein